MRTKEEKERLKTAIGNLSDRAKFWGQLLLTHRMDYPIIEAHHTALDRLINEIPDGKLALKLVFMTFAELGKDEGIGITMEDALLVGQERAVEILQNCLATPFTRVNAEAEKYIREYQAGKHREGEVRVLKGSDEAVKSQLDDLVLRLTSSWRD